MQNQIDIRCMSCGQVTPTTNRAQRFRCSSCFNQIYVQSQTIHSNSNLGYGLKVINQNKCVMNGSAYTLKNKGLRAAPMSTRFIDGGKIGGKKKALICGVSYNDQKYKLRGTHNDAHAMKEFLVRRCGFSIDYICLLTEGDGGERRSTHHPTKKNMEEGLRWLVEGCEVGDSLVFYFSGHGINQRESSYGDEIDSMDESLCPVDFTTEGVIRDDHLNSVLVRPLPRGVTLHAIVDACHSGTILDLPWVFDAKQNEWVDNRPPSGAEKGAINGGRVISLSACRDNQMAADTSAFSNKGSNKTMNGALTMSFIQALENTNLDLSYHSLVIQMQESISKSRGCKFRIILDKLIRRYFVQDPLLSSSVKFDVFREKVWL